MSKSIESCGPVPGALHILYKCFYYFITVLLMLYDLDPEVPFPMFLSLLSFRAVCYSPFTNGTSHFYLLSQLFHFQIKLFEVQLMYVPILCVPFFDLPC